MIRHDNCRFCGTILKGPQTLIGACNWCLKERSDMAQSKDDMPAMSYSFCEDDDYDDSEDA